MAATKHDALAEQAFLAVARDGFGGLRLRSVAQAVGIDHSTLHHYYPTKSNLIRAVVLRATDPLRGTLPADGEPRERLSAHLQSLAGLMESTPELFVVLAEVDLLAQRDASVWEHIDAVEAGWRRALASVLADAESVELLVATVKGVRLEPRRAPRVLHTLEASLATRTR